MNLGVDLCFLLMTRGPPRSTPTDKHIPYTTLFSTRCAPILLWTRSPRGSAVPKVATRGNTLRRNSIQPLCARPGARHNAAASSLMARSATPARMSADRKRVVSGTSVLVSVDLGGRSLNKTYHSTIPHYYFHKDK